MSLAEQYHAWLRLASHLGMSIDECMRQHTERHLRLWNAWFEAEWNRPNRSDNYLMAVVHALHSVPAWVWGKDPKLDVNSFKIQFESGKGKAKESEDVTKNKRIMAKQLAIVMVGGHVEHRTRPRTAADQPWPGS